MNELSDFWLCTIMVISQAGSYWLRSINIQFIAKGAMIPSVVTSTFLAGAYLVGAAVGVKGILEGNALMIILFLASSGLGTWIAMRKKG